MAARPRLNATIRARPKPIRCSAIALSRTTSADGHGSRPAATPTPSSPRRWVPCECPCVVVVRVAVVMVTWPRRAEPPDQHGAADSDHEHARGERQPGVERLGDDELREQERHEPEREDADRVRDGDDPAEQDRVERAAPRADEVAGDDRLAVPGRERVRCTPEGRDREREQDHAEREVAAGDERLEAAAAMLGRRVVVERRRCAAALAQRERSGRRGDVERRAEQILRVGAEVVAPARRRDAGGAQLGSVARAYDDFLPADPRAEVAVAERQLRPRRRRLVDGVEAERLEAARTGPLDAAPLEDAEGRAAAVDAELEPAGGLGREAGAANPLPRLQRRDLGQVERVVDVDAPARELDRRVAVDREVAERVRLRDAGRE